jgi:hypothetical protein
MSTNKRFFHVLPPIILGMRIDIRGCPRFLSAAFGDLPGAEVVAMIADAHPEIAPHHPRPVREPEEWLWDDRAPIGPK